MSDPYKVLGVPPTASDEEVKSAYRELARKYHPDSYVNNPLADLAGEKMQEINEAYDQVQQERKNRGQRAGGYTSTSGYGTAGGSRQSTSGGGYSQFADIRRLITGGRVTEAEELLDGVPQAQRNAEWYFLKGNVYYSRGWLEEAMNAFTQANRMEPGVAEYQNALNQMMWQRRTGTSRTSYGSYRGSQVGGCSGSDLCINLICADCCCECMGGDLIGCC